MEEINLELKKFQNGQNLAHILKKTNVIIGELVEEMKSYGITERVIKKILRGEEIILCNGCMTPNMYLTMNNIAINIDLYVCDKCGKNNYEENI
jgi:superfamily II helicase